MFWAVFWCLGVSNFEKFSSPFKSLCLGQCLGVSVFQTLKRFQVLVFGAVFWCLGVSDFEKILISCVWGGVLVFQKKEKFLSPCV